ncbi:hypothetical protein V5799_028939 [Amblyomma americanum]|uniref:TRAF1-6 MATH domain-containing protein n=1 Tax=Amblyomma americanum TaxID=6943 RepID=A0AAQ4DBF5_AMBAM
MSEHWYTSCQFHNIVCIKCKSRVLQKDIVQHIREGCASNILPRTQDTTGGSESGEHVGNSGGVPQSQRFDVATIATSDVVRALNNLLGEKFASLQNKIQEHVTYERKQCEMVFTQCLDGAKLDTLAAMKDHVIEANNAQNDVCSQLKEDIMNIGHGISEQLEATTKDNVQAMEQLQDLMAKESEKTLRISRKTLEFASSVPNCHEWVVRGWAEMKTKALAQGEAWDFSQPRYFCGYLLKPAVLVYRDEESELKVHAGLELRKGSNDDYLEWPFCKSCRLTFVHPRVRPTARSLTLTPDAETFSELGKPEGGVNGAAVFSAGNYCHARDLENEGYVSADEIRIRFEVMF